MTKQALGPFEVEGLLGKWKFVLNFTVSYVIPSNSWISLSLVANILRFICNTEWGD